jgi:nicotinic acid mononucleotide adenylyltransferase
MLIADIHASGHQLVLEFAGAGSVALAALHAVPGSSRTILEATDRYSAASMEALLGHLPEKFVVPTTAAAMAQRAYIRACRLGDPARPRLGVACTATISTGHLKRGLHRACIAVQDHLRLTTLDLVLAKGRRFRESEEQLISELLISAIATAAGIKNDPHLALLPRERIVRKTVSRPDPIERLLAGRAKWVVIDPDGSRRANAPVRGIIYSGSFNPLHFGHEALAGATGRPVTFELPVINAEKSPLDRRELENRLAQFRHQRIAVTRAPLFANKARLFPRAVFLVGHDTAVRLVDPRFYRNSKLHRDRALAAIRAARCRILVAGRVENGVFKTLHDIRLPAAAAELFVALPNFRADVSATALRDAISRHKTI